MNLNGDGTKPRQKNVLGEKLEDCSRNPLTGFFRDGCCKTGAGDIGSHTVCTQVTEDFLRFSYERGNDLITPRPEFDFPGLKPGDSWCVCAARWREALQAGVAPPVNLKATHQAALNYVSLEDLKRYSLEF